MRKLRSKCKPVNGIKTISPMIGIPQFNMIRGFSIDYLHCVLTGVSNRLFNLFFDTSKKEYSISPAKAKVLDNRILGIRPPSEISRKPRSHIRYRSDLKANEIRSLLLYYLPVALRGLLPKMYQDNFCLLSPIIYYYIWYQLFVIWVLCGPNQHLVLRSIMVV